MRPMRRFDCLIAFMCRQCRKFWEPSPPEGLMASPSQSQWNQNLSLFLVFLNLFVLISFIAEMYAI